MFLLQQSHSITLPDHKRSSGKDFAAGSRGLLYGTIPSLTLKSLERRATKPAGIAATVRRGLRVHMISKLYCLQA